MIKIINALWNFYEKFLIWTKQHPDQELNKYIEFLCNGDSLSKAILQTNLRSYLPTHNLKYPHIKDRVATITIVKRWLNLIYEVSKRVNEKLEDTLSIQPLNAPVGICYYQENVKSNIVSAAIEARSFRLAACLPMELVTDYRHLEHEILNIVCKELSDEIVTYVTSQIKKSLQPSLTSKISRDVLDECTAVHISVDCHLPISHRNVIRHVGVLAPDEILLAHTENFLTGAIYAPYTLNSIMETDSQSFQMIQKFIYRCGILIVNPSKFKLLKVV